MRILHIIPYYHPATSFGGPIVIAHTLAKEFSKRGNDVEVYTSDAMNLTSRVESAGSVLLDGVKVTYFRNLSMLFVGWAKLFITLGMIQALQSTIKTFDLVHLHDYYSFQNIIASYYAKKSNVPYTIHVHGSLSEDDNHKLLKWIYNILFGRRILQNASKVIALSDVEFNQYKSKKLFDDDIVIIPNGIDIISNSLPINNIFKNKHGIADHEKYILYLGRINQFKGIDYLLDAFDVLMKKDVNSNVRLVICGPDDGYLSNVLKKIEAYDLSKNIIFTGPLFDQEKIHILSDASVVTSLDSLKEVVFLLVPLEAAACGTPVIVTNTNYISTLVDEYNFGYSVEYNDVEDLVNGLETILHDETVEIELGVNGREYVTCNFHWDLIYDKVETLYQSITQA